MIEKIEILQHSEGSDLSSHSCEETLRFLCIVSYHHELVVKLEKTVSILFLKRLCATF